MKPYGALHSKRVCRFESRADLVDALLASCHLPLMSDGSLTTRFRGRRVIDGGEPGWGRAGGRWEADLEGALLASCHLPLMSDGSLTARFRGRRVIDGGGWRGGPAEPSFCQGWQDRIYAGLMELTVCQRLMELTV